MTGASPDGDRAGGPADLSRPASQPEALIPSAKRRKIIVDPDAGCFFGTRADGSWFTTGV